MPSADQRRSIPADATVSQWLAPDGWPLRRLDWPSPGGRGRLMLLAGRGDFIEKYLETLVYFHAAGWSVTAFDWRGQGGSGRLSPDPHVGHAASFRPFVDDLAAIWRAWSLEGQGPRAIIGHSMGGYLTLRAMLDHAIDPDAAILVAPMLGLKAPLGPRVGRWISWLMTRLGDPARAAWKGNERPASTASRRRLLTHDAVRYSDEMWWHVHDPVLRLGPPSWAWVAEGFAATLALDADPGVTAMAVPTLLLIAEADKLVDPQAAVRIGARLPRHRIERFGGESAHEILREADAVRDRALAAIDRFLDEYAA